MTNKDEEYTIHDEYFRKTKNLAQSIQRETDDERIKRLASDIIVYTHEYAYDEQLLERASLHEEAERTRVLNDLHGENKRRVAQEAHEIVQNVISDEDVEKLRSLIDILDYKDPIRTLHQQPIPRGRIEETRNELKEEKEVSETHSSALDW